jgi:hypothetical protein
MLSEALQCADVENSSKQHKKKTHYNTNQLIFSVVSVNREKYLSSFRKTATFKGTRNSKKMLELSVTSDAF